MTDKKIIKISYYHGFADMRRYFSKEFFTNYTFEINNPDCIECDYWIVFGDLPVKNEITKVNSQNIFLFTAEFDGGYNQKFLKQFKKVFTADPRLRGDNISYYHLGNPWFVNQNFDHLYQQTTVNKTKLLSVVVSDFSGVTYSRNYKIRHDFVMALKKHFGSDIDIFGRGFNEIKNKEDGLLPYKFSIAIENMPLPYNMSEKLYDCFLTHTFPLYYDCPNVNRFIDERAYAKLDIMDHEYSINMIENILNTPNFYENHVDALIEAKKKYLMNYSFQGVMVNVIKKFGINDLIKEQVTIKSDNKLRSRIKLKLIDVVFRALR
jgi:hypothetical protein